MSSRKELGPGSFGSPFCTAICPSRERNQLIITLAAFGWGALFNSAIIVPPALRNGASRYVLKDCTAADLVQAVRTVAAGRRYLSPVLAERALTGYVEHPGESELDVYETLTNRERLVLQLAAEGKTSAEIAAALFISPRTAETHRANLMRKLNLRSQTDLVRFAIRRGIIAA